MNEEAETIAFLGLGATAIILFALRLFNENPIARQLVPVLFAGAACALIVMGSTKVIQRLFPRLQISSILRLIEGGDVAVLSSENHDILIKAFEVNKGPDLEPSYQQTEHRSFASQTPLEALVKVGVKARVMTSIHRPERETSLEPDKDAEEPALLRTVVLVFERCESSQFDQARRELERQYEVAQSAVLTSTRNCQVKSLRGDELLRFLEGFYLYERREDGVLSGSVSLKDISSMHFQEGQRIDIIGGSYVPSLQDAECILLGNTLFAGAQGPSCRIPLSSLSKHVTIFGCTGAGKSNTAKILLKQLVEKGIPVLVLDFHNEYLELLDSVGGSTIRLSGEHHIDVLYPSEAEDFNDHISIVTDVFNHAYHFTASQHFIFRENLMQAFAAHRLGGNHFDLQSVVNKIEQYETKTFYEHETKFALLRRLKPLIEGEGRKAFVTGRPLRIAELVKRPCVIALGDLKDTGLRNLLAVMVLALIYELRLSEGSSSLKHATVIEESQNVIPYRLRTEEATIFEKMFFEMRKYGECLILLAQFPTQIFPDVVKSAGIKFVHRLTEAGEAEVIMDVMGLGRLPYSQLKYLPEGRAIALIDNLGGPITVQIPLLETDLPASQLQ